MVSKAEGWPMVSTTPAAKLPPVPTTPVANLPPVSTTPAANFATSFSSVVDTGGKFAIGVNDTSGKLPPVSLTPVATGGKQWDQYQAEDTLKWTWRQKFIYMLTLLSKGVPTKLLKFFWLKVFSFATDVVNLELRISPRILEKIQNGPNGILWGWGETDLKKNQKQKISWHCPFKELVLNFANSSLSLLEWPPDKHLRQEPQW